MRNHSNIKPVALVTGGSSGIGRATALAFAREGIRVIIADIDDVGGIETTKLIEQHDGEAIFVHTDVSQTGEVQSLINKVGEMYGRLDYAHNNAGTSSSRKAPTADYLEEDWDRIIATNLKGVWLCMKYELAYMQTLGKGAIVNTASIAGLIGHPGHSAYGASKHGIVGLTKTAALEYAQSGIRINAVCPGYIQTPMLERGVQRDGGGPELITGMLSKQPSGRLGTPEEVAEAVVWLCSDAATYITGQTLTIDGGFIVQ